MSRDRKQGKEFEGPRKKKELKDRVCLRCDKKFRSYYNRLCWKCKETNARVVEYI